MEDPSHLNSFKQLFFTYKPKLVMGWIDSKLWLVAENKTMARIIVEPRFLRKSFPVLALWSDVCKEQDKNGRDYMTEQAKRIMNVNLWMIAAADISAADMKRVSAYTW